MATNVLTTGTDSTPSSEVVVTSDTLFSLKAAASGARVNIELKNDGATFDVIGALTQAAPAGILAAGTYRFTRVGGISCGVYSA